MKIAALIIGILIMLLGFIALVVCLALPELTSNRVNFEEALLGVIPSVLVLFFGFIITLIAVIFLIKGRKKNQQMQPPPAPGV
jgi:hypothetical protein